MYRIRFHGRGGQGIKTASRLLGSALFQEGFEVQDAPRYGAERRGAPIFADVRAARAPVTERGVIRQPDLVVVADETCIGIPAAGVIAGLGPATVLLVHGHTTATAWRERLRLRGPVLVLHEGEGATGAPRPVGAVGAACAGAAARLLGVVSRAALERALDEELAKLGTEALQASAVEALAAFDALIDEAGCVVEGMALTLASEAAPRWVELPCEDAFAAAPTIHAAATSGQAETGLWRTARPVVDAARCGHCTWVCSTFCPDGAIAALAGSDPPLPDIDYAHCKGCMICVAVCPWHAIAALPERPEVGR